MKTYERCSDCPFHRVINDRDPSDWFNDDDKAVVCSLVPNPAQDANSKFLANRNPHRVVEPAVRPYKVYQVPSPDWCPLKKNTNSSGIVQMPPDIVHHNGCNERCDAAVGPCCCGATHRLEDWPADIQRKVITYKE
jgi:hypothetical protein